MSAHSKEAGRKFVGSARACDILGQAPPTPVTWRDKVKAKLSLPSDALIRHNRDRARINSLGTVVNTDY
jgi:hypothetical protein